jgi:hypothetical protein
MSIISHTKANFSIIDSFLISITSLIVYFVIFPTQALARIVINEFLADPSNDLDENEHEWVELYNNSNDPVDLTGYVISDEKNNILTITTDYVSGTTIIEANSYKFIKRNGAKLSLNNSDETVFLYAPEDTSNPIDQVSYNKTYNNKSIGRIPDGVGEFVNNLDPTPGSANLLPPPTPTPTPKPTSTPKPSATTKPTQIPSTPKPTTATQVLPTPQTLGATATSPSKKSVASTSAAPKTLLLSVPKASPNIQSDSQPLPNSQPSVHYVYFIISGLSLTLASVFALFRKRSSYHY